MTGCGTTYEFRKGEKVTGKATDAAKENLVNYTDMPKDATNKIPEVWDKNFPTEYMNGLTVDKDQLISTYDKDDVYHLIAERRLFYSSADDCKRMEP